MEVYDRVFDANCTYHVTPYDGIVELLQALKEKGMKLTVLSNKPHRQAVHVVEEVFGKEMFDWVQGQQEGIPRKPDPYAAIQIAEKFGVKPEEMCIHRRLRSRCRHGNGCQDEDAGRYLGIPKR